MLSNKTSHIEKIANALKKASPDNPLLKTMRRRWQIVKNGEPPQPTASTPTARKLAWQRPHAAFTFDAANETWAQFKQRAGL